jgi:hypothetical protein
MAGFIKSKTGWSVSPKMVKDRLVVPKYHVPLYTPMLLSR